MFTTFSPLQVYGKMFCHSRASNSKMNNPIWPKIKFAQDFMPVLITCNFEEDPIKNESVRAVSTFFPL